MTRLISDQQVDEALHYLRDSAFQIGKARAAMILADRHVKHIEALLFFDSEEKSVEAKKLSVRLDERWLEATTAEAEAAGEFEKLKALREAAAARLECWRTESATLRGAKL